MVTRSGDALAPYQATMTSQPDGFFNGGAFVSPASQKLILNLRMAIYDENKQPVGLVGGGPFLSGMNEILSKTKVSSFDNAEYAVLDAANNIYIYHSDNSKIMEEIDDEALKKAAELANEKNKTGYINSNDDTIAYYFMDDIGFIITMKYKTSLLMSDSNKIQTDFIIFVIIAELIGYTA
ncbi:MAG: cache domain-containing protein [Ruminiclostridium sp.]|nr:cache domain-containing protein [Ruminiclostridium sp.]